MDEVLDRRRARTVSLLLLATVSWACDKKGHEPSPPAPEAKPAPAPTAPEKPLPGFTATLEGDARASFFKLVDRVPSPCGKPESLRKTLETDRECLRGPFAAKFLETLVDMGASEEEAFERYAMRYALKPVEIDSSKATRSGPADAKVQIVEFFDFGCSHCAETAPQIDKVIAHYGDKVSVAYMDYPLGAWPTSEPAGRAALAAGKQGKFKEYAHALFETYQKQDEPVLQKIASDLKLDLGKWEKDRQSAELKAQMAWESAQGDKLKLQGRPAIFVNGRQVFGPPVFEWIKFWVDEELAVNP
jgi:protein-disulfide isomerase